MGLPAAAGGADEAARAGAAEGDGATAAGEADGAMAGEADGAAGDGDEAAAAGAAGAVAGWGWAAAGAEVGGEVVLPLHATRRPLPLSTTATLADVSKTRRVMGIHPSADIGTA